MADYFFDSIALVKNYVKERGSEQVKALLDPSVGNGFYVSHITVVEVIAALNRCARRGDIGEQDTRILIQEFREEIRTLAMIVRVTEEIVEQAADLASRHLLRGYDAVQLSTAIAVNGQRLVRETEPLSLVSSDAELNIAAASEGFSVINPTMGYYRHGF